MLTGCLCVYAYWLSVCVCACACVLTGCIVCVSTADCSKSVLDCAGEKANPFFGAVASGKFEVATLEKLCP